MVMVMMVTLTIAQLDTRFFYFFSLALSLCFSASPLIYFQAAAKLFDRSWHSRNNLKSHCHQQTGRMLHAILPSVKEKTKLLFLRMTKCRSYTMKSLAIYFNYRMRQRYIDEYPCANRYTRCTGCVYGFVDKGNGNLFKSLDILTVIPNFVLSPCEKFLFLLVLLFLLELLDIVGQGWRG